jgi:cell division protein FtsI (penicillin-binding protein 3)
VTIDEWNTLRNYPILNGNLGYVYFTRAEDKRIYPLGDVARQVIGRHTALKDKDDKEIKGTGIEYFFDEHLKGHNGSVKEQWIAHGFWARVEEDDNQLPENGCNIITTIDAGIQRVADEQLRKVLQEQNASFGVAIVMEVETGNILAMANLGSGRERGNEYSERVENHALRSRMMPGSTMKLATTMALLEIGGYNLDTKVNTEHSRPNHGVKVGAAKIEDTHDAAGKDSDGNVTLKDAFAHSSNVYFAKAIYETFKSNPKEYTDFLAKLRFNDYIGLEKYGEVQGDLTMADSPKWNTKGSTSSRLPRLAYGYEMDVPPIHMLTFYNGVANEGRMVAPRIVDRIERDGEVIEKMPVVTLINRMCSKKTLAALDTCLAAASERTGRYFRDLAIPFGCKTGTAQMWSTFVSESRIDKHQMKDGINGKQDNYYYGSIICTMPQENPKYTIMVGVCKQATPDSPSYFGIDLSAPVAADIMEYIYANDHTLHSAVEKAEEPHTPETIKGGKTKHVAKIGALTNDVDNESDGASWSQATVEAGETTINAVAIEEGRVPDVRGMGLTDALFLLEKSGLRVTHRGSGRVRTQSLAPGYKIANNTRIELVLER